MSDSFHMIRLRLHGPDIFRIGGRSVLSRQPVDDGYLVHCALRELFGELAPHPFMIGESRGRWMEVLGYSSASAGILAKAFERAVQQAGNKAGWLDGASVRSKLMPGSFPAKARLNFRLRACPVVRKGRGSREKRAGAEVDAFLVAVERGGLGANLDRRAVYAEWLAEGFRRRDAAVCESISLKAMKLDKLVRRGDEREAYTMNRPDVVFEGRLRVEEPAAFNELVRHGVGRHRAFGFGMLLLKPVR